MNIDNVYKEQIDGVYKERNTLVAFIAQLLHFGGANVGVGKHEGEDWDPEWRTIVYMDMPTGQTSWHLHDSEVHLLKNLPTYDGVWDGHSTAEKYARIEKLVLEVANEQASEGKAEAQEGMGSEMPGGV